MNRPELNLFWKRITETKCRAHQRIVGVHDTHVAVLVSKMLYHTVRMVCTSFFHRKVTTFFLSYSVHWKPIINLVQQQWRRDEFPLPGYRVSTYITWNSSVRKLCLFLGSIFFLSQWLQILLIFIEQNARTLRILQSVGCSWTMKNPMSLNTSSLSFEK